MRNLTPPLFKTSYEPAANLLNSCNFFLHTRVLRKYILTSVIDLDPALSFKSHHCNMKSPSEDWSEDAPTIVEPSRNSIRREVELMIEAMKKASVGKDQAVIGVVRPDALALLEQKCKPAWYKRLIGKSELPSQFLGTILIVLPTRVRRLPFLGHDRPRASGGYCDAPK
jgi:hypothetical protein